MIKLDRLPGLAKRTMKSLAGLAGISISRLPRNQPVSSTQFWTEHNVTHHFQFSSREESLNYLDWRNGQYLFYDELMPCSGFDGKVILDHGCGPGHDLVGFLEHSRPRHLYGLDVSPTSLAEARHRLNFHDGGNVELQLIKSTDPRLPFPDESVDYIHCSGVLHHIPNAKDLLKEFSRVLKPSGLARIMVYNFHSIWVHLYVAYMRRIVNGLDPGLTLEQSFQKSTDTERCPVSRWYKCDEFIDLAKKAGLNGEYLGAAVSTSEMELLPQRFQAIADLRLPQEHRHFLRNLSFDSFARPLWDGQVAGIDGVYQLSKNESCC